MHFLIARNWIVHLKNAVFSAIDHFIKLMKIFKFGSRRWCSRRHWRWAGHAPAVAEPDPGCAVLQGPQHVDLVSGTRVEQVIDLDLEVRRRHRWGFLSFCQIDDWIRLSQPNMEAIPATFLKRWMRDLSIPLHVEEVALPKIWKLVSWNIYGTSPKLASPWMAQPFGLCYACLRLAGLCMMFMGPLHDDWIWPWNYFLYGW